MEHRRGIRGIRGIRPPFNHHIKIDALAVESIAKDGSEMLESCTTPEGIYYFHYDTPFRRWTLKFRDEVIEANPESKLQRHHLVKIADRHYQKLRKAK